jgi:hypothetical protein
MLGEFRLKAALTATLRIFPTVDVAGSNPVVATSNLFCLEFFGLNTLEY